MRHMKH